MSYAGGGTNKDVARAFLYLFPYRTTKIFAFDVPEADKPLAKKAYHYLYGADRHHIGIASQYCGDVGFLKSFNVNPANFIACDTDPLARLRAAEMGATVSPHDDIFETIAWAKKVKLRASSVNIDLCGCLTDSVVEKTKKVLEERSSYTAVSLTICKRHPFGKEHLLAARDNLFTNGFGGTPNVAIHYNGGSNGSTGVAMLTYCWFPIDSLDRWYREVTVRHEQSSTDEYGIHHIHSKEFADRFPYAHRPSRRTGKTTWDNRAVYDERKAFFVDGGERFFGLKGLEC
jgi:hypothetical protein